MKHTSVTVRSTLLIVILIFYSLHSMADQEKPPVPAVPSHTDSLITAVKDSIKAVKDSIIVVKNNVQKMQAAAVNDSLALVIDTSAIDAFKANAKAIYANDLFNKKKKHTGWEVLRFIICIILLLAVLAGGIYLSVTTALCRDVSYKENGELRPVKERPFSFARVQLFWWTLVVLTCYIYFYAVIGELLPPNITTATLLGFGSIVYAMGKVIDQRQISKNRTGARAQDENAAHNSFLEDILSDNEGISIHRFQSAVFNIVFGIGYIGFFITSFRHQLYPLVDFTEWQFALLGISSATYLTMKTTENNPAAQPAAAVASNNADAAAATGATATAESNVPSEEPTERNPNLF